MTCPTYMVMMCHISGAVGNVTSIHTFVFDQFALLHGMYVCMYVCMYV